MRSRQSLPGIKLLGLERSARLAGESFGYEDIAGLRGIGGESSQARWLWWLAAAVALAGLIALALR